MSADIDSGYDDAHADWLDDMRELDREEEYALELADREDALGDELADRFERGES